MEKSEYIFGTRAVMEVLKEGRPVEKVLIKKGLSNELFKQLYTLLLETGTPFQFVPLEKINRITQKNHQGVLALLSPVEFQDIEKLLPSVFETGKFPFFLILDQITDVRNFGAILRSAECAGVHAVIIPEKGMARIGADAVKTSAGAINHIPVCRVKNLSDTVQFLKESGIKVFAATEKASKLYTAADFKLPVAVVMGSEEHGISGKILQLSDEQLRIPVVGKIESLNVSVAAALMMYEVVRQKNQA